MKIQGFILLDVDVVALNNAGKSTSTNFDNAVATKKITKNGRSYVYVSGQAWRYWWRETLQKYFGWNISPITREKKIAFTEANPIIYDDDDVFGYMKAAKEIITDEKGKEKKQDITVTRVSPLKNSVIVSAGTVRVVENWSSMSRQEGDAVPYGKEEYSAIMKGMFSLDIDQVGTFSSYNKTGFKNLTQELEKEALKKDAALINDPFLKDKNGNAKKLIRLNKEIRTKRIIETIQALKIISGGAMQTSNMGDVTPKFIILATMSTGNHPFGNAVSSSGINGEQISLNIAGIKQILEDYKKQIQGNVYIGKTEGFFNEFNTDFENLVNENPNIKFSSVGEAIDNYTKEIKNLIE